MSGQMEQIDSSVGSGSTGGGANVQAQHHQSVEDATGLPGTDQQFVMLRTAMRQKMLEYTRRKPSSADYEHRLPAITQSLEEILYEKFPNKNDYYNMMKGPILPALRFAVKIDQNQRNQRNPQLESHTLRWPSSNPMDQLVDGGGGGGGGDDDGQLHHQPVEDAAGLMGTDRQFVMLRNAMRETILEFIRWRPTVASAERQRRLPVMTKYLEEILYTKFSNKDDYYNMMKGPILPPLRFALRTFIAQNLQNRRRIV